MPKRRAADARARAPPSRLARPAAPRREPSSHPGCFAPQAARPAPPSRASHLRCLAPQARRPDANTADGDATEVRARTPLATQPPQAARSPPAPRTSDPAAGRANGAQARRRHPTTPYYSTCGCFSYSSLPTMRMRQRWTHQKHLKKLKMYYILFGEHPDEEDWLRCLLAPKQVALNSLGV